MEKSIIQVLRKNVGDSYSQAELYYSILSVMNSLQMTEREIQLAAFTAIRGNISYTTIREDFCKKHNSSSATIYNIVSRLKKIGVFVKDGTKIKINPLILLNFDIPLKLEIFLSNG